MGKNDGGPAFPRPNLQQAGEVNAENDMCYREWGAEGMSLRDWFAGQALQGMCAANPKTSSVELAAFCYAMAGAMLAERAK
jgi:hypothetical protein